MPRRPQPPHVEGEQLHARRLRPEADAVAGCAARLHPRGDGCALHHRPRRRAREWARRVGDELHDRVIDLWDEIRSPRLDPRCEAPFSALAAALRNDTNARQGVGVTGWTRRDLTYACSVTSRHTLVPLVAPGHGPPRTSLLIAAPERLRSSSKCPRVASNVIDVYSSAESAPAPSRPCPAPSPVLFPASYTATSPLPPPESEATLEEARSSSPNCRAPVGAARSAAIGTRNVARISTCLPDATRTALGMPPSASGLAPRCTWPDCSRNALSSGTKRWRSRPAFVTLRSRGSERVLLGAWGEALPPPWFHPLLTQPKSTRRVASPADLGQHPNCCMPFEVAKVRLGELMSSTGVKALQSSGADEGRSARKGAPGCGRSPM